MAGYELVRGQIVRIDLSEDTKPDRDLVWLKLVAMYGNQRVKANRTGEVYEVELPPHPWLAEMQLLVETTIPRQIELST